MLDFDKTWKYLGNVLYNEKCEEGKEIGIEIDFEQYDWGDKYHNENGEFFIVTMFGSKYELGYNYTTEDADDWAQAECYHSNWCKKDDKNIKCEELLELVQNFQQLNREYKLSRIL
jgi:hypothetical protein